MCKIGKKILCICIRLIGQLLPWKQNPTFVHTLLHNWPRFCTATVTSVESQESVRTCLEHIWHRSYWKLVTLLFWHKNQNFFLSQKYNVSNFWKTGKGKFTKYFRSFGRFSLDLIFRDVQSLRKKPFAFSNQFTFHRKNYQILWA